MEIDWNFDVQILEDEGVYTEVQLGEYDLGLIPFEDDVFSMEISESYREVNLSHSKNKHTTSL